MAQKRYTISTKINEREYEDMSRLAERENISITAIMKLFSDALLNGDVELEKGELKTCTPPHEYCISDEDFTENLKYKEYRMDKLVKTFEDLGYPDYVVRQIIENLIGQLREKGKYNARRSCADWGC